jgi:cellulose synthase/poly-beta-1,6-N-acetylglucosamine synthase-like glycosyltransferase
VFEIPPRELIPPNAPARGIIRRIVVRALVTINLFLGLYYLSWRLTNSINWAAWPIALALIAAEAYSFIDAFFFGLTIWRVRSRKRPARPSQGLSVDVFITCYNEPVGVVRQTVRAAVRIFYPHRTYVLDDAKSSEMHAMATSEGAAYLVRSTDWDGYDRHAKAGNLNNALNQTKGEFILILDADQVPSPLILDRTLGYFDDPQVAFVQTPQWFRNVPRDDPFGSDAPLFYGPIQQGKDGWNAAFFCGSNGIFRREALMHQGLVNYVQDLNQRVRIALQEAERVLKSTAKQTPDSGRSNRVIRELLAAVLEARQALAERAPVQDVTSVFQERVNAISRSIVEEDITHISVELAEIPGLDRSDLVSMLDVVEDKATLGALSQRDASPLAALETMRNLISAIDTDRSDQAQPIMPMSTISVTEDLATSMRLHALGCKSVYHPEVLAQGLAPEDLRTALQQRLRWGQGTMQVMFRQNPLFFPGLSFGQRMMYLATMWTYLSGFPSVVYLIAPVLYLFFGISPVRAYSAEFFAYLIPYLVVNQLVFVGASWGLQTWRAQQYALALFPIWIKSVITAAANVFFGRKLPFIVTSKTRQEGSHWKLVAPQLITNLLLAAAGIWGLVQIATNPSANGLAITINIFWVCYNLFALRVLVDALSFSALARPQREQVPSASQSSA